MIKARRLSDVDYVAELGAHSLFLTLPTERMTHSDSAGRNGCAPSARAENNRKRMRNITGCRSVPGIRPEVHPNASGSRAPLGNRCAIVGVPHQDGSATRSGNRNAYRKW